MPQIIIATDEATGNWPTEVHRERIVPADFETETASSLLIERIGWALNDAEALESPKPIK
jgi:hypothetical protein